MKKYTDESSKTPIEDSHDMHSKKVSLEHEYKYVASKDDIKSIRDVLSNSDFVNSVKREVQINYYYDTIDYYFNKSNTTLRIRQKESGLEFQVKIKDYYGDHHNKEITESIDSIPTHLLYEGYNVKLQGHLVTDRTRFSFDNGLTVDLDINYFCGIVDYEIEIELPNDETNLDCILSLIHDFKQAKSGKATRFYNRLFSLGEK